MRKGRHAGLAWPAYCNKPKRSPPVMDGMLRTLTYGDRCRKAENQHLRLRVFQCPPTGGAGAPA